MTEAQTVIDTLALQPHPEGGWFREVFRDQSSTAIYYLLRAGERSHWHRIGPVETWHFYAGAPLELMLSQDGITRTVHILGSNLVADERPQVIVPRRCWQAAKSLGAWSLVGCTVAPPFDFKEFELAPPDWSPG